MLIRYPESWDHTDISRDKILIRGSGINMPLCSIRNAHTLEAYTRKKKYFALLLDRLLISGCHFEKKLDVINEPNPQVGHIANSRLLRMDRFRPRQKRNKSMLSWKVIYEIVLSVFTVSSSKSLKSYWSRTRAILNKRNKLWLLKNTKTHRTVTLHEGVLWKSTATTHRDDVHARGF
jgi:hypothetical protein